MCRFVNRGHVKNLLENKKKLKNLSTGNMNKVFVNEDLTPLRAKLLYLIKQQERNVVTMDGRILVYRPGQYRPLIVENPDDLFKLGFYNVDNHTLGLERYVVQ
jgi:hypothetical protein